ncbi:VapE domain-containing protein [Sorangium sp. So ce693]|uniref:VapE domain-containing protein n=1 Tax=Sorangium sp. So ce693 TaxID=3133318 RepID=UPI003F63C0B4
MERRLDSAALEGEALAELGGSVRMVAAVFDVDDPASHKRNGDINQADPLMAASLWWENESAKIRDLRAEHNVFVYRTRGGYRIVARLTPFVLTSKNDAAEWSHLYLTWVAYLKRRFKIAADPVKDWTRLFRLPHATRLEHVAEGETEEQQIAREERNLAARPEERVTVGDPNAIELWNPLTNSEDEAAAQTMNKRRQKKTAASKTKYDTTPCVRPSGTGTGLFYFLLSARNLLGPEIRPGEYAIKCPCMEEHSTSSTFESRSTVLFLPDEGQEIGAIDCKHTGCGHDRFTAKDWLSRFTEDEIAAARAAAGLPPRRGKGAFPVIRAPEPPPSTETTSWTMRLRRSKEGVLPEMANIDFILANDPNFVHVGYDFFRDSVAIRNEIELHGYKLSGSWQDHYYTAVTVYLQKTYEISRLKVTDVKLAVRLAASRRQFSSLQDHLRALPAWDGVQRLDTWLSTYLGVARTPYTSMVGRYWMVGTVARAMKPGCKFDNTLVLEGARDIKKSMVATILGGAFAKAGMLGNLEDRLALRAIKGSWIIELEEVKRLFSKTNEEAVKGFFSRSTDRYCRLYEENETEQPRQCSFIATVNPGEDGYFTDLSGNRNWWPVEVTKVNKDALEADRNQLFAETLTAFDAGERWWAEDAEKALCKSEQVARMQRGIWDEEVAQYVEGKPYVRVADILLNAIEKPLAQHTPKDREEVRRVLLALGWAKGPNKKVNGASVKFYYPPAAEPAKPEANKVNVDMKPEETVTSSKTYVDRRAQHEARVAARKITDQNINHQFDDHSAAPERMNRPPIRAPEPAASQEPVQRSVTALQNSQPAPARTKPEGTKCELIDPTTNMVSGASMISKERKPMTEHNNSVTEAEPAVPASDDVHEGARSGMEMLQGAITRLEELLAAGHPLPTWLQGKVNTTRVNEIDRMDGAALLAASIANITRLLGVRPPSKEAPTMGLH